VLGAGPLSELPVTERGWTLDVLNIVRRLPFVPWWFNFLIFSTNFLAHSVPVVYNSLAQAAEPGDRLI
jgi:hypothetical protein